MTQRCQGRHTRWGAVFGIQVQLTYLPDDVTGLLAAPVPGLAAFSAVVNAVRGLALLPVPGRAELVLGLTKPVRGRPDDDIGRMAGEAPPCGRETNSTEAVCKAAGHALLLSMLCCAGLCCLQAVCSDATSSC